jgi:hypothetical protein
MVSLDCHVVAGLLRAMGHDADVRGNGAAQFVFASNNGRFAEISASDVGIWVEYWDGDMDAPKFDRTFARADDATVDVQKWLAGSVLSA